MHGGAPEFPGKLAGASFCTQEYSACPENRLAVRSRGRNFRTGCATLCVVAAARLTVASETYRRCHNGDRTGVAQVVVAGGSRIRLCCFGGHHWPGDRLLGFAAR